ncbi:T9SS type A sorting domain-containing protein [Gillisia marina]|uniref:T9SS type A sorting domain-containing protein n=1 Tax=Gillisia marina TaxID=1167637 RepID=UPI00029AFBD3|nr:T9SS type A sorting domain-containing protein [Gillisia marina]
MEDLRPEILETVSLSPNPVVSTSTVRFSVIKDTNITLRVYDYSGRMIETLFTGAVKAFENTDVEFQRRNLMSGIYIVKLTTANGHSYDKRIIRE